MSNFLARMKDLGYTLPAAPKPIGLYRPALRVGELVYTSGQGPILDGKPQFHGKVGKDLTIEEAKKAAELTILNVLSVLNDEIGGLHKTARVVKLLGFINSAEGFTRQPEVLNGASEVLIKIFGENGKGARSAIGVNELPMNIPVEIEGIFQVRD